MNTEGYFHPETENYKFWTIEEGNRLRDIVNTGKFSYKQIGKLMNRSSNSCRSHARKVLDIKNKYLTHKYEVNKNFWNEQNLLNCYWNGFLQADGYSEYKTNKNHTLALSLSVLDKHQVEKFKKDCDYTGPISIDSRIKDGKTYSMATVRIHCKKWGEDLKSSNFNLLPQKTYRIAPPEFKNRLFALSFTLAYLDGDGSVIMNVHNRPVVKVLSCSKTIIQWIRDLIDKEFNNCKIRKTTSKIRQNKNAWETSIEGIQACAVIDYLNKFPVPFLKRKWLKPNILQYIEEQKLKYPHLFLPLPVFSDEELSYTKENTSQSINSPVIQEEELLTLTK